MQLCSPCRNSYTVLPSVALATTVLHHFGWNWNYCWSVSCYGGKWPWQPSILEAYLATTKSPSPTPLSQTVSSSNTLPHGAESLQSHATYPSQLQLHPAPLVPELTLPTLSWGKGALAKPLHRSFPVTAGPAPRDPHRSSTFPSREMMPWCSCSVYPSLLMLLHPAACARANAVPSLLGKQESLPVSISPVSMDSINFKSKIYF